MSEDKQVAVRTSALQRSATMDGSQHGHHHHKHVRRFPVFFPPRVAFIRDEWTWSPYNVWWLLIICATYFTVLFVPFDVAFSRETTGTYLQLVAQITQSSCVRL